MVKKFQRHAKGGRFKQQDFGDLGLSALKRNNDTIIDNLKLQSARNKEYRDDTEQSLRDVGRNELKNIQDLNSLENKIYKNKVGNIKVRADREIEAIRGQAKEAGKKSDFWKEFSLTHSKKYGKLAEGLTNLGEHLLSQSKLKEYYDSGGLDVDVSNQTEFETNTRNSITLDKIRTEDYSVRYELSKEDLSMLPTFSNGVSKDIQDNWSIVEQQIKDLTGTNLAESNVVRLYEEHVKAILNKAGISPRTKGYTEAVRFARSKGLAQKVVFRNGREIKETAEIIESYAKAHNANTPGHPSYTTEWTTDMAVDAKAKAYESKSATFNALVEAFNGGTFRGQYGNPASRYADRGSNMQEASVKAAEYLLHTNNYTDLEDFLDDTYNLYTLDGKTTWIKRHGGKNLQVLEDAFIKKQDHDIKLSDAAHKSKQIAETNDIKNRISNPDSVDDKGESNYIDASTDEGKLLLWEQMIASPNNVSLQKLVGPYITFDPNMRVPQIDATNMINDLQANNPKGFMSVYSLLTQAERESFQIDYKVAQDLERIAGIKDVPTSSKALATEKIGAIDKLALTGAGSVGTSRAKEAYIQILHNKFAELSNEKSNDYVEDPTLRWRRSVEAVDELLNDGAENGHGIFRRSKPTEEGGRVVWYSWTKDPKEKQKQMTTEFIGKQINANGNNYEKFLNKLNTVNQDPDALANWQDDEGYGYIVAKDEIDDALVSIKNGRVVQANNNISFIAESFSTEDETLTSAHVWNDLLNLANGVTRANKEEYEHYVRDNDVNHAERKFNNLPGFLTKDVRQALNEYEKVAVGKVADIYSATSMFPMKEHIRTWWGGKKKNPDWIEGVHGLTPEEKINLIYSDPILDNFKLTTGIEYEKLESGNIVFSDMAGAIKVKDTFLVDYWYNPNTNEFVPNKPYGDNDK